MALIVDPHRLPVIGIDDHLPALPHARLAEAAVRQRFAQPPHWAPQTEREPRLGERPSTPAAVLIALVQHPQPTVLLTMRTAHLNDHPGQISFPGGRVEASDADPVHTALREAQEEVGLDPTLVDVLGTMPTYTTGTGFVVTPVVGAVRPGFPVRPDPHEVAEVFEVPLSFLMNPAHHRRHAVTLASGRREFLSMPWRGPDAHGRHQDYFIWGATAAMLRNLYRFLVA